ncbi:MAG: hypothetical protein ACR2IH_00510 [Pyrinomonadaceae bacterium]
MKFDTIYLADGSNEPCYNVTNAVGAGGSNLFDDVVLVQAMLRLIAGYSLSAAGLTEAGYRAPEVSGTMDNDTYTAIGQFPIANNGNLIVGTFDGRVDPAHYKGRKIHGNHPLMTITRLHQIATDASVAIRATT